jgi:hypothetical protein
VTRRRAQSDEGQTADRLLYWRKSRRRFSCFMPDEGFTATLSKVKPTGVLSVYDPVACGDPAWAHGRTTQVRVTLELSNHSRLDTRLDSLDRRRDHGAIGRGRLTIRQYRPIGRHRSGSWAGSHASGEPEGNVVWRAQRHPLPAFLGYGSAMRDVDNTAPPQVEA